MNEPIQKKNTWIWALPVVATILVVFHYVSPARQRPTNTARPPKLECEAFQVPTGWGYDITVNNKKVIYQDRIPAVPGHKTFVSKEDALKVGNLMIEKLKGGEFPPFVSYQEMKNIGIVFR